MNTIRALRIRLLLTNGGEWYRCMEIGVDTGVEDSVHGVTDLVDTQAMEESKHELVELEETQCEGEMSFFFMEN